MTMIFVILLIILIALIIWLIATYNHLIRLSNLAQESWSGIDVQLKRRYDLIPNLIETVKGYAKHEKEVFEKVTKLRAQSMHAQTIKEKSQAETQLTEALKTLFAVAENYPELKANENFKHLQQELANIENEIQLSRRYYNGTIRNYMSSIQSFPTNLVAQIAHFKPKAYFELEIEKERETPQVKF